MAGTMAAGPKPKRAIGFVAFPAEEKGDQGSEFFARHPPLPVVANINMDMFLMLYPVGDLVALGGEHSTLGDLAAEIADRVEHQKHVHVDVRHHRQRRMRSEEHTSGLQ